MAKRKVHELLEVILLVLCIDVHHGVQHVPGALKSVFNQFLLKTSSVSDSLHFDADQDPDPTPDPTLH